ncbi:MAG TPA: hypothetical protein VHW03_06560 [Chthoniobacterales bacterium]|nr:hypothetical protein [Chthoniobacterales bacterium]
MHARLENDRRKIFRIDLERFIGQLFALGLIAARKRALAGRDVSIDRFAILAHRRVQIGEAYLDAQIVGLGGQQFLQKRNRFGLPIILEVNFGQLQEQRPGLAHYALLDVEVSKFLERANLFGSKFCNAFVNGDRFGEESVANENLREALEIVDGLKGFALADVQLADGHQRDLIARLVLQNLLIFRNGLGDLALVEEFLSGFDVFAFVIGHSSSDNSPSAPVAGDAFPRRAA